MSARFQSILNDMSPRPVQFGQWEDVSPVLQRRRKLDGSYEYRPNPARAGSSPNVGVVGEDPREKAIREARERTAERPQSLGAQVMGQMHPRIAANLARTPEMAAGLQGIAERVNPGMRPKRPAPQGLSPTELLNPRTLYPAAVREKVEQVLAKEEEAKQHLATRMAEAGYSPTASALADFGLDFAATTVGDAANALPVVGLLGNRPRAPHPSSRFDAILRPEIKLAEQLPEAPGLPAWRPKVSLQRPLGPLPKGIIPPEALPFELRDLPLTRWEDPKRPDSFNPHRGGQFWDVGDSTAYASTGMEGGMVPVQEVWTPKRPLVISGSKSAVAEQLAPPPLEPEITRVANAGEAIEDAAAEGGPVARYFADQWVVAHPDGRVEGFGGGMGGSMAASRRVAELRPPGYVRDVNELRGTGQYFEDRVLTDHARQNGYDSIVHVSNNGIEVVKLDPSDIGYRRLPSERALAAARGELPHQVEYQGLESVLEPARTRGQATVGRAMGEPVSVQPGPSGRGFEDMPDDAYVPVNPEATGAEVARAIEEARTRGFRQVPPEMPPELRRFAEERGFDPDRMDPADPKLLKEYDRAISPPEPEVPGYFWDAETQGWRIGDRVFEKEWQAKDLQARMGNASREVAEQPLRPGIGPAGRFKPSESGHLTFGREPVKADPATEAYRASLFKEKPDSQGPLARLEQAKETLLYEFDAADRAYTKRMTAAGAPEVGEMNALELRRAGHTALMPIHYGTRRWDPLTAEWEMTGPPMEALTAGMDEATARQVETVMQAQSQVEFGKREIAAWQKRMAEDPKTAGPEPVSFARFAEAQQYLRDMEASGELAKVEPHAQAARDFEDRAVLQPLVRLGVITEETAKEIRATNQFHAIQMLAEEKIGTELRSGEALGTHSSPLQRREYGLLEDERYVPTFQAMAIQAARVDKFQVRQMVRNDVAQRVLSQPDLWPEFRPARAGETAGTFPFWKSGEKGLIKAPGDFLDVVDNLQPQQVGPLWKVARTAKQVMTTLATLAPHFPGMNFLRDQATAGVFSRSTKPIGLIPYASAGKQLFQNVYSMFTKGEATKAWKEFQASAAGHSTFLHADQEGMMRTLEEARLRSTPAGRRKLLLRRAANPLFIPDVIGNSLESATRVAEREILLKEGKGAREATTGAAKVSIDFSAGGRTNKKINEVTGFHNVRWLDNSRFLKEFLGKNVPGRKFKLAFRASLFVTLPALAEEYLHRDDEAYQNIPLWDQGLFYHFGGDTVEGSGPGGLPTGKDMAEGWYKRFPRPQGLLNLVFGILPQLALRQALRDDPHAAQMALRGLLDGTPLGEIVAQTDQGGTTFSLEAVPTILRGPAELLTNRKWTGAPVVPEDIRSGPPAEQWNERTSPVARRLAGAAPEWAPEPLRSPMQLEHLISSQTAGTGRLALDMLNPLARASYGEEEPPREPLSPRDVPVVRNFMTAPPEGFQSQPVEDLYHLSDRVSALGEMIRRAGTDASGNLTPRADAIGRRYGVDPDGMDGARIDPGEVEDARSQLAEWRAEEAEIIASQIPDDLKRARLRLLRQRVTRFASQQMASWRLRYPTLFE